MPSDAATEAPIRAEVRAYWQSLGRFLSEFAYLEAVFQIMLWHYAKVSTNVGRAVFSGVRGHVAIDFINRIADAEKWDATKKSKLKELFEHFGQINSLRNDIIHFGVQFAGDGSFHVTNALMALTDDRLRKHTVSDKILDQMSHDVRKINYSLFVRMFDDPNIVPAPEVLAAFRKEADEPWQYKPARQSGRARKSSKTPQGRSLRT